eukprot:COSAG05_NODE_308_length_11651_cov_65.387985_5_plen_125_part_00
MFRRDCQRPAYVVICSARAGSVSFLIAPRHPELTFVNCHGVFDGQRYVNMKDNNLGGVLPEKLQGLQNVHSFLLPVNQISGTLPVMIGESSNAHVSFMKLLSLLTNSYGYLGGLGSPRFSSQVL